MATREWVPPPRQFTLGIASRDALPILRDMLLTVAANVLSSDDPSAPAAIANAAAVVVGLSPHYLSSDLARRARRLISWNTEQLSRAAVLRELAQDVEAARDEGLRYEVWDYCAYNARAAAAVGLEMRVVPCVPLRSEVEALKAHLRQWRQRATHDVAFVGSLGDRRRRVLDALAAAGASVLRVSATRDERDVAIARCRVLLNIHFDADYVVFEGVRCARWIAAGARLVTECGVEDPPCSETTSVVNYNDLVGATLAAVNESRARTGVAPCAPGGGRYDEFCRVWR